MSNESNTLISRLQDEAGQCRNDGADDIARLLDETVSALGGPSQPLASSEDVKALREALAAKPTPGPYQVIEDRHPYKTTTGGGEHIERRIFTAWDHPQMKGPIGVVNIAVGLGAENKQPRHFVGMSNEDAAFFAACSPDRIARLLSALESREKDAGWLPIERAPSGKEMFVVRAFNVCNGFTGGKPYTSDAYAVWRQDDGTFARWPHNFQPTHFHRLPTHPTQEQQHA